MRFPVRFTSDFQLGVAARIARARGRQPLTLRPGTFSGVPDPLPQVESVPSLVWIGGFEPLDHPEVPKFANAVAASAREVFLQTKGELFRRRVHEFQPSRRFRLAFRFAGASIDAPENADVVEAIRIAKLSGFLTIGVTVLGAAAGLEKMIALHSQLKKLDLDGSLIFAADASPELNRAAEAARSRLLDGRWSNLSRVFNDAGSRAWLRGAPSRPATPAERCFPAQASGVTGTDLDLDEGAQA
ncbi:MAG: hypothetical protein JO260_05860 [Acidobacteria bacterium]|nr:hypothetical protein [Acidobacteriota bacterium]